MIANLVPVAAMTIDDHLAKNKPRPMGRVLGRFFDGLGKIRGFRCSP
jgi:hypothetical protein